MILRRALDNDEADAGPRSGGWGGVSDAARNPIEAAIARSIDRIHRTSALGAWSYLDEEGACSAARLLDQESTAVSGSPSLSGVPIGVKESIAVAGMPFEAGSDVYRGHVAARDSAVVRTLRTHGAIPLGVNVMHAHGLGDAVRYGHRATARHPWNDDYVPGGSSSGTAVATAAGGCLVGIGGDTGGSVRGPAASCGVLGWKPTYGSVDSAGSTPLAWSMDSLGFFARDISMLWEVAIAFGFFDRAPGDEISGCSIGVVSPGSLPELSDEIGDHYASVRDQLIDSEHEIHDLSIDGIGEAPDIWLARMAEFRAVLSREMVTAPARIPTSIQRVYAAAELVSLADYQQSWTAGAQLKGVIDQALSNVDVLLLPAAPSRPLKWSTWTESGLAGSEVSGWYRYLQPFNITGHPALTLPWSLLDDNIPVAIQLVAKHGQERQLLSAARQLQQLSPWRDVTPAQVSSLLADDMEKNWGI